jgi:hypothetical protein
MHVPFSPLNANANVAKTDPPSAMLGLSDGTSGYLIAD